MKTLMNGSQIIKNAPHPLYRYYTTYYGELNPEWNMDQVIYLNTSLLGSTILGTS